MQVVAGHARDIERRRVRLENGYPSIASVHTQHAGKKVFWNRPPVHKGSIFNRSGASGSAA
jgi:hypothetical protein